MSKARRAVLVVLVVAMGLVFAPFPQLAWSTEMETRTEHPALLHSVVDGVERGLARAADRRAFTAIGVSLSEAPATPLRFRVEGTDGWGPWREFEFGDGHAPDGADEDPAAGPAGTAAVSDPYWVGEATGYEIDAPAGTADLAVHLVTPAIRRVRVNAQGPTADAQVLDDAPDINTRAEWGARPAAAPPATADALELAVVHHSDTANGYAPGDVPSILRSIQAFHIDVNGWDDIAYNFAIDKYGQIWEARGGGVRRAIIGGHSYGFNTGSVGVVVLGDFVDQLPTQASLDSLADLLAWKLAQHQTPHAGTFTYRSGSDTMFGPEGTAVQLPRIVGHTDVRSTACPGSIQDRLPALRAAVADRYPGYQATAPARPVPGDLTADGAGDLLLYRPGDAEDPEWSGGDGPSFTAEATNIRGSYIPIAGDFDGSGTGDVFWYAPGPAKDYLWLRRPDGSRTSYARQVGGQYEPYVGDFDGNGRDDILWHGPYGGRDIIWYFRQDGGLDGVRTRIDGHVEIHVGDFDGNGADDLLLYGPGDDADAIWYGGGGGLEPVGMRVSGIYRVRTGDFDGNGVDDVLWYGPGSDADHIWWIRSNRTRTATHPDMRGNYQPFVADFDGDGREDIYWHGPGAQPDQQWWQTAQGPVVTDAEYGVDDPVIVVDVDGDGTDEIVWLTSPTTGEIWSASAVGRTFDRTPAPGLAEGPDRTLVERVVENRLGGG